jgi:hypothetical protein
MSIKVEIGLRLKDFAKKKFGSVAELERLLRKPPAFFQSYIGGRSFLGGEILMQLAERGCDINFLLTGKRGISVDEETKKKISDMEQRLEKIESKMFRLLEENEKLKDVIDEKDKEIERLSVQSEKTLTLDVPSKLDKHKP